MATITKYKGPFGNSRFGLIVVNFVAYKSRHESKKRKKRYPSNLSDGAWRYLKPHLPVSEVGRPRELSLRQVLNAILYVLKTGCQWRQLPREFPA